MRLIIGLVVLAVVLWHMHSLHKSASVLNTLQFRLRSVQLAAWRSLLMSEQDRFDVVHEIAIDSGFALDAGGFDSSLPDDLREAVKRRITGSSAEG